MKQLFQDFSDSFFNNQPRQFRLSDGQKWALGVVALNTLVFLLWKVPAAEKLMWQFFTNSYASSMFSNCFSLSNQCFQKVYVLLWY